MLVDASPVIESADRAASGLFGLMQPIGGLFGPAVRPVMPSCEPIFDVRVVHLGEFAGRTVRSRTGKPPSRGMAGAGVGLSYDDAIVPALAEGLERYCTCVFSPDEFITASARELGNDALDLDLIPRCSQKELAHPKCPLVAPDKSAPIRWVRGLSIVTGRVVYIPAVHVYLLNLTAVSESERIAVPITTGCAAYTSYEGALLRAILEVIERDAISLIWLQRLRLPRIDVDDVPAELEPYWERYRRSTRDLEYILFDGTTDLGVFTVYALQIAREDSRVRTLVSCGTDMEPLRAIGKVIRDLAHLRLAFRGEHVVPDSVDSFSDILDGATYMSRAEHAAAFDFLLGSIDVRRVSEFGRPEPSDERVKLRQLLRRLQQLGLDVYAVDLSSDEAVRAGIRVVRAVIPGLQPLSFWHRARYLGHARLYEAPARMGQRIHDEDAINHWPQPFA